MINHDDTDVEGIPFRYTCIYTSIYLYNDCT